MLDDIPVGIATDRVCRTAIQDDAKRPLSQAKQNIADGEIALKADSLDLVIPSKNRLPSAQSRRRTLPEAA